MTSPDFQTVATLALRDAQSLLATWLPNGKRNGHEYDVLNPTRDDHCTGNFRINIATGQWADFATDAKGGDLISLYAYLNKISQTDALQAVMQQLGMTTPIDPTIAPFVYRLQTPQESTATCLAPIPLDAPSAPLPAHASVWTYLSAHGEILGYIVRFDKPNDRKEFRPLTYWSDGWRFKTWPRPAPLYHQDLLALRLDAPVLVVEGEKTAEAATVHFPSFVATTWPGGASNAKHADWRRLTGRRVWLLPDADEPGKKAMTTIAEALRGLALEIHLAILPTALPPGWDVADADFLTPEDASAWLEGLDWQCVQSPPTSPVTRFDDRFEAVLARANGKGPKHEARIHEEKPLLPWPHPLLEQLEHEILKRVPYQSLIAARVTTKAILAHLTGRQVVSKSNDPTPLYLALVAPSISEVRGYLAAAAALLEQMGLSKTVRQARLSSPTQLFKALWRSPDLLYLCPEWGIKLQFAKRQPAGLLEQTLTIISDAWDGHPLVIDPDEVKLKDFNDGQGQAKIPAPHLTMLATLSHDQLVVAMKLSEAGRGALDQTQYWILDDDEFTATDPEIQVRDPYPDTLLEGLRTLLPVQEGNLVGLTGPQPIEPQIVPFAENAFTGVFDPLEALPVTRQARSLVRTARLIARREATALAFLLHRQTQQPLRIDGPLMTQAIRDEQVRLSRLLGRFNTLSSDDGKLSLYQKVLDFITAEKSKGARPSDLISGCRAYRAAKDPDREALITQMLSDGVIVETYPESKPGARRKSLIYIASQYAREVKS